MYILYRKPNINFTFSPKSMSNATVDLLVYGHYWGERPSQGKLYALTCFGQNEDTAIGAAKHSLGIEWMIMTHQLPLFRTHILCETM